MESNLNECTLQKFYRRNQHHMLMFGWVQCCRKNFPMLSIDKAVLQFIDHYGLDIDRDSLANTYKIMSRELMEAEKS